MTKLLTHIEICNGPIWNECIDLLCLVESHGGPVCVDEVCVDEVCVDEVCADEVCADEVCVITSSVSYIYIPEII